MQFFGLHSPPVHPGSVSVTSSFSTLISGFLSSSVIVLGGSVSASRLPTSITSDEDVFLKSRVSRAYDFSSSHEIAKIRTYLRLAKRRDKVNRARVCLCLLRGKKESLPIFPLFYHRFLYYSRTYAVFT